MPPELQQGPEEIGADDGTLRLIVFGDPGVGKTTLAMTFPRPLVINTDFGLEGDILDNLPEGALGITPEGYKDLEALYFWLRDNADLYDTIVIDTLDELVQTLLDEIVDEGKGSPDKRGRQSSILDFVPEPGEYQANQRQMRRFLSALRKLRKHVVIVSAVRDNKSNGKRTVDVAPGQQGIVKRFGSVMGELVVTPIEEGGDNHRVLLVDPGSERAECKTRYSALLPYVVEPTYDSIWASIAAARNAD